MRKRTATAGFVLLELVTTLVLVGVIGTFAALFLWNGINGYMSSKRNSEAALSAQIALDRLSSELRHVTSLPSVPTANEITYRSADLPGTRRLRYADNIIYLSVNGNENPLLKNIDTFRLAVDGANLDNDGADIQEVSAIRVGFNVQDVATHFDVRVYPRAFIPKP